MTLVLQLPPETEAKLCERARQAGKAPETLALEKLCEGLDGDAPAPEILAGDAWLAEFNAWVASQQPRNPIFDDSRESIYSDRS
jgi:hypothetical protein